MIDPRIWGNAPGFGRAPLLPTPQAPAAATAAPRQNIVRLLQQATGNNRVMPGDRPVGMLVRDPSQMTIDEMVMESRALEGPMGYAGNVGATLASGGTLGLGTLGGLAARRGVGMRQEQLNPAIEQRLGGILATGQPTPRTMQPDPYEQGREAARVTLTRKPGAGRVVRESRSDADRADDRGYGRSRGSDIGAGGWGGSGGL